MAAKTQTVESTSTATLSSTETCGQCMRTPAQIRTARGAKGKKRPVVMVAMAPGKDGKPWSLCVTCWKDGIKNRHTA